MTPPPLFHFCCRHAASRIGRYGLIIPQVEHPTLRVRVSWFTTQAEPDRELIGLTSNTLHCDRMEYRYVVTDPSACMPWLGSEFRAAALASGVPGAVADAESGHDPEHWWVSALAVKATQDRTWTAERRPA